MLKNMKSVRAVILLMMFSASWIPPRALAQLLPPILPPLPTGSLVVTMTAPASGSPVAGTVAVSASVSIVGTLTVGNVQFQLDGANLGAADTSAPYSISWNTAGASNGQHTLRAVARDALLGLTFTSAPITVTVNNAPPPPPPDTTPPTVSITSPGPGASVSGTTGVSASASDNVGVASVQFRLDGANLGAADTVAPYSVSWNTTTASNGSHTLVAIALDAAGNSTPSATVTVTVNNGPAPDTAPPSVSITSPGNGQTIKGTVSVSANASDNVGVAAVQFLVDDGVNGSAEDTTAPYSVSWNTATASDGSYTITAVARDAAGNTTTSAPVTVTVTNAAPPPPPPPAQVKRFEETDPAVTYTAGWGSDAQGGLSQGHAAFSDAPGAQAAFTFTGTSVSWIGGRSFETGIARVFLDGNFVAQIDTYAKTAEVQVPIYTATGLANTSHTLTIEAAGQKNVAALSAFILVDAFDVPAATISRLQETDPAVRFTLDWVRGDTGDRWSGGTAAASVTAGAQATFTFTGTGIRAIGAHGPQHGIARILLDGAFVTEVDTFAPADPVHAVQVQAETFKKTDLADTSHTLTIEVTGRMNSLSTAAIVVVDAFEVMTSGTRHEETDPAISYTAGWLQDNRDGPYSQGTAAVGTIPGSRAAFTFTGTSVSWIGSLGPQNGIARIFLDGALAADNVDTYAPTDGPQNVVFRLSGLPAGAHTVTIEATGSKNAASIGIAIVVDAFDVTP